MDSKHIKLSLMILASLIILSYAFFVGAQENSQTSNNIFIDSDQDGLSDQEEKLYGTDPHNPDTDGDGYSDGVEVKSGYDPLKPAPGDRIIIPADTAPAKNTPTSQSDSADSSDTGNLTKKVAKKVASLISTTDTSNQQITLDQVKNMVSDSLNQTVTEDDLPQISPDEIKIKKQDYSKLPAAEAAKKKKEDFTNYMVAVYYILASNSPTPIHSSDTLSGLSNTITQKITYAIENRDPSQLQDLSVFGQKVLNQLIDVEVPEDMVDIHTKALRFAKYAITLKDSIAPNEADPMADLAQLSKIEAFLEELASFSTEAQNKLSSYDLQIDDSLLGKINKLGVEVPQIDTSAIPANTVTDSAPTSAGSTTVNSNSTGTANASLNQ